MTMDHPMTKEESYADRRKLFKDIWDTSMHIDEKDDIIKKPKVIKTLRLAEMDRCPIGKKKKQKIKNLRAVCNKLLDFCDRQDADDLFYQQMAAQGKEPPTRVTESLKSSKIKKVRKLKPKKIRRAKSMQEPANAGQARGTTSEGKKVMKLTRNTISRHTSPIKVKRTTITFATSKVLKPKQSSITKTSKTVTHKVVKKKPSKKTKPADFEIAPGRKARYKYINTPFKGNTVSPTRQYLTMAKVNVGYTLL